MADIIELDAHRPHYAGPCSCLKCKHEWVGVVPETTDVVECPNCGAWQGVVFSAREVRLLRALEEIATGTCGSKGDDWRVMKDVARAALIDAGYGDFASAQTQPQEK